MSEIVSLLVVFSLIAIFIRLFLSHGSYEKILSFYLIFTNLSILILVNSAANFDEILDIVIILFFLKLVVVLFLLFNRKKI